MAQRLLKLLNTMSGKFQKFNFRKFVFKKRKDKRSPHEGILRGKSKETSGLQRHLKTTSDFDVSLKPRNTNAAGAVSEVSLHDAVSKRYEPKISPFGGPQKATSDVLSSVKDFNQLPKRRSNALEHKSVSMIDDPLSYVDSMSRNVKEATWGEANTSPFVYQKSVSTPCVGMKKTVKSATSDFGGLAVGWPNLRTWDVPGPKARFPATTAETAHVPSFSMSLNNVRQESSNKFPLLSSDGRAAISKRAKKIYALKLITGEIWNQEPDSVPYIVERELSENSQNVKLNPIIGNRLTSQKVAFQDKAGKTLVDTVKKVVNPDVQPANQGLETIAGKFQNFHLRRIQANHDRNKTNFSKNARTPSVEASRAYSDTNNIYLSKLKNSEHKVPRYRNMGKQMDKDVKARNALPIPGKEADAVGASTLSYGHRMPNISGASSLKETQEEQKTAEKTLHSTAPSTEKGASFLRQVKGELNTVEKSPESPPPITEKGRTSDGWQIKKMSDFVWKKLKRMSDFATSNLKPTSKTANSPQPAMENLELNVKKVPEVAKQTVKRTADRTVPDLNDVKDLSGIDLKNITQFPRPIPKYGYEFLKPIPKHISEFPRPILKNVADTARLNTNNVAAPNFYKDKGYAWANSNNGFKFIEPNLKTVQMPATTIKNLPYFEVANTKKENDNVLPNIMKEYVRPNMGSQRDIFEPKTEEESENPETIPNIAPIHSEKIANNKVSSAAVSKHETLFMQEESKTSKVYNYSALNSNEGSQEGEPILEKQEQTIQEPIEGNGLDVVEASHKKKPGLEIQNPESLSDHSEPNLKISSEFGKESLKKVTQVALSGKTPVLDSLKVEINPELDRLKFKQFPDSLPPTKKFVPKTSKDRALNQFPSIMADKDSKSIHKTLYDTAKANTHNITSEKIKNIPKISGEIVSKPPVYRQKDIESSWKIYMVHKPHGNGLNSAISQHQNTNASFFNTRIPSQTTIYSPENKANHSWKKMISSSHYPPSSSYGTENLMTTRKINSTNLQNYPSPQMFNRMERGENKFLLFWKGREDTYLLPNPNKKPSLPLPPVYPRRIASSEVKAQDSVAECKPSEDESLSRKLIVQPPSEISSCTEKSSENVSSFLPVVCVPLETLPCVLSNTEPENKGSQKIE